MTRSNFSDDFKRDAWRRSLNGAIRYRRFPSVWVSALTRSTRWKKKFAEPAGGDERHAEIRRLKRELSRVTEESDILKKATAYFARGAK